MVRIGILGIGFMGMIHFYAAKKLEQGKVTAIATRNPRHSNPKCKRGNSLRPGFPSLTHRVTMARFSGKTVARNFKTCASGFDADSLKPEAQAKG